MNKIYVGNLPYSTAEKDLEELFSQYGNIVELVIIRDNYSNRSKGFGFITFDNEHSVDDALSMNEKEFMGRNLIVNIAKPRKEGGGRGGRSGGGGRGGFDRKRY